MQYDIIIKNKLRKKHHKNKMIISLRYKEARMLKINNISIYNETIFIQTSTFGPDLISIYNENFLNYNEMSTIMKLS